MSTYFIIGADEREYGPASAEEVHQWIREHRADAGTRIRLEGEVVWRRLGEQAEFSESAAAAEVGMGETAGARAASAEAGVRAASVPGAGVRYAAEVLDRGYELQIGDCFARGWELLVGRFGLLVGATALVYLLYFGIWSIPGIGVGAVIVLSFVLLGGLNLLFLKELRGEPVNIGVVFAGIESAFLPLLLAGTVATCLVLVGGLLCLAPGIYLLVAWHLFAPLLILDKGLDFWDALECSRRVVTRHWWICGGLFLLAVLAVGAGLLACLVGVAVTLPLATAAVVVAYEQIFGSGSQTTPSALPVNPMSEPGGPGPATETELCREEDGVVCEPDVQPAERPAAEQARDAEPGSGGVSQEADVSGSAEPAQQPGGAGATTNPQRRVRAADKPEKGRKPRSGVRVRRKV